LIDTITKIITFFVLIIGAIFSYFKFFYGKTFSEKMKINFIIRVFNYDNTKRLHILDLEFENTGIRMIEDIMPIVTIKYIDENESGIEETIEENSKTLRDYRLEIESKEVEQCQYLSYIKKDVEFVSYRIKINMNNFIWDKLITIPNANGYVFRNNPITLN